MSAEDLDDTFYVFVVLALRRHNTDTSALHSQRLARTRHFHTLITAKRRHGSVHAGQSVLRSSDCELTLFNLPTQMSGIVQQGLPIYLPRIVKPRPILRAPPAHKCLPPITVCFDRPVMSAAKHIFQRFRPVIAHLPALAKIAPK